MKRIEQAMCLAIRQGKTWTQDNTAVRQNHGVTEVTLFGHPIARFTEHFGTIITLAGWPTKTTVGRLNALAQEFTWPFRIQIKNGSPMFLFKSGHTQDMDSHAWYDALTGKEIPK